MPEENSKYPIGDMGDNFQPDAMEDFDRRAASGEFDNMSMEEIRRKYVEEEIQYVEEQEALEMLAYEDRQNELDGH